MYAIVYTLLIVLYLISIFVPMVLLNYIVGIIAVIVLIVSTFYAKGIYWYTGLVFLIIGIILFFYSDLPVYEFFLQFHSMLGLLSLFLVLLFINCIIYIGKFDKTIKQFLQQKINHWDQLYGRTSMATHLLSNFLNIATIPFIVKSLKSSLIGFPKSEVDSFCSRTLLRSYALALTWSPMEVIVSSTIDITGAKYLVIFPIMLLLTIIIIFVDVKVLSIMRYRKISYTPMIPQKVSNSDILQKKILQLVLFLIFLIIIVSVVQLTLHQGFLLSVVLVLPLYSIIWSQILKKRTRYLAVIKGMWKKHTFGLSNYFFLFLSAGFFVNMLSHTSWMLTLQTFYINFIDFPLCFYLLTASFFMVASLIGFHPLIALTFFSVIIQPMVNQLSALPFSVVLIACCLSTVMYSPFNLSVSLLSNELNINPYKITIWNIGFAIFYMLLSISFAYILHFIF